MSAPQPPHIALFPSAGMGHLMPFLRLAAMLAKQDSIVTIITAQPTVSIAESDHISSFLRLNPKINHLELQLTPSFQQADSPPVDPFFLQMHLINQSLHLLPPLLLSSSPPFSAIFVDFLLVAKVAPIAKTLNLPIYILSTSSVPFLSLMAYLPMLALNSVEFNKTSTEVKIPGLPPMAMSSLPPVFHDSSHLLTSIITTNSPALSEAKGILMNTFEWFEASTLAALNKDRVIKNLPPVLPIGPLEPYQVPHDDDQHQYRSWLENQPAESVVYISFGSRTAMSRDQTRELEKGLEKTGWRFFWVLKTSKVDKDDQEDAEHFLNESFLEKTKDKGLVIKGWVEQQEILRHPAIGGFLSHCGWNSVMEGAIHGVPMLAWPQHGDQRLNAQVMEDAGLGLWERNWDWGPNSIVKGEDIEKKIVELMTDEKLRGRAKKVRDEARKAVGRGGTSDVVIRELVDSLTISF
ncbi:hypothetical protein BT93_H0909 [Corymbia citriodora subsp. variegata]|nr:hypothetical protein BT93_H0909 [Corymbia citriodora subsp. variegata]